MDLQQEAKQSLIELEEALLDFEQEPHNTALTGEALEKLNQFRLFAQIMELDSVLLAVNLLTTLLQAVQAKEMNLSENRLGLFFEAVELIRQVAGFHQSAPLESRSTLPPTAQAKTNSAIPASPPSKSKIEGNGTKTSETQGSIKVEVKKLEQIDATLQEVVIRYSILAQSNENEKVTELGKMLEQLKEQIHALQSISVKPLLMKMKHLVTSTAMKTGKQIEYVMQGADCLLDKKLVEELSEPLLHLLRNACDHGIETTQERTAQGKPPLAKVSLSFEATQDEALITITDDGKGLSTRRILKKALEKGVAQADQSYSNQEIWQFIFQSGFSTAQTLSDISGRGVGMDVVKQKIHRLGGEIHLESQEGIGTRVLLKIPLKSSLNGIFKGIITQVGPYRCAIPLQYVKEVLDGSKLRLDAKDKQILHQGKALAVYPLAELFHSEGAKKQKALVLEADAQAKCVITVDRVLGEQDIVSRGFGSYIRQLSARSLIYGMGYCGDELSLVLDVENLLQSEVAA